MEVCGRSLLVTICTCFRLIQLVYGYTSYIALPGTIMIITGSSTRLQISISRGTDCQNGGTQISSDTCLCPGGLSGKQVSVHSIITFKEKYVQEIDSSIPLGNHSLYISFDTLENLILMEGTEKSDSDPRVEGQFNLRVNTRRDQRQWIDLGFQPEVCLTNRYFCGASGGAMSLWLRVFDCSDNGGMITTTPSSQHSGFKILCPSPGNLQYFMTFPNGFFRSNPTPVPATISFSFFHILFNFVGPNNGEGFRVYHDGQLV